MSEQRINKINISCLEILDNKEQEKGGKYISILCRSRGDGDSDLTGPATLLPSGKKLTIRKIEKNENGQYIAILRGILRTDLRRKQILLPQTYAVSSGKDAFFLLPSSKSRFEKGSFFVSGGVFPEYNGDSLKPSASISFHGRVAAVRFFHYFPLVTGAKYFIATEENRDLRTPVTLVYPGKLNQKDSAVLSDRLLKFGGRPSLKALYSIILRTDSAVELPEYMCEETFEGSVRSGNWAIMSREYDRIKNAVLKRTAAFGGIPEKELSEKIRGNWQTVSQIIDELSGKGSILRKDGYLINGERDSLSSLSPVAAKLLDDLKTEENGINLSQVSNPLFAQTYKALIRLDLVKKLSDDIILHESRVKELKELLFMKIETGDELDLTEFRTILPLSRRLLIPFLEEMDKEGYFDWNGEKRIVLKKD